MCSEIKKTVFNEPGAKAPKQLWNMRDEGREAEPGAGRERAAAPSGAATKCSADLRAAIYKRYMGKHCWPCRQADAGKGPPLCRSAGRQKKAHQHLDWSNIWLMRRENMEPRCDPASEAAAEGAVASSPPPACTAIAHTLH
jgi:hypothetical protein